MGQLGELAGTSATQAKRKYNEKTYDRLYPMVKKGKKEFYKMAAEKSGLTFNEFMEKTLDEVAEAINGETVEEYLKD